ncbi:Phosphatidylglycerol/phosphatidylinositol transfer protein [Mortierella polycephala]|uniref:Phosphatidylglycerol/phosphatidylinositol transfer protein n=1 Tax=Mortierella polycephala TaxID=41804 RepID=A0A9P6PMA1_9FUNG|nr:Phosphatidylglycerol/phosphatidylinositol transfer protein [Mortierella polycephala]
MRLTSAFISLACAFSLASAAILPFSNYAIPPATIEECGDPETDLLKIDYVTLNPNPPLKGEVLQIDAKGYLSEDIVEGAVIKIIVKLGLIKLLVKQFDFCEESIKVNKTCPVLAGDQYLNHSVELPKEIPPGKYFVNIRVFNPDEKEVTCLNARATFGI